MTTIRVSGFPVAGTAAPADLLYGVQSGVEKGIPLSVLAAAIVAIYPSGQGAATKTTAGFTQPAAAANVSVPVINTSWMAVGQMIYVSGGGFYSVASITNAVTVVLTNLGYTGGATTGATVATNAGVVTGGWQGIQGIQGIQGPSGAAAYTTTTASFTQPAVNSAITVPVTNSQWLTVGQTVFVGTGGYYTVTAIPNNASVTIQNLGYTGNAAPAATVPTAQGVSASGVGGALTGVTPIANGGTAATTAANAILNLLRGAFTRETAGGTLIAGGNYSIYTGGGALTMYLPSYANTQAGDTIFISNLLAQWVLYAFTIACPANVYIHVPGGTTAGQQDTSLVCNMNAGGFVLVCNWKDGTNAYWSILP